MIKKVIAIIMFVMVASLSVAGCFGPNPSPIPTVTTPTPTSTATPPVDYSSALGKSFESGNSIVERPFTKSTNELGNDVYKGVLRNATLPGSQSVTVVIETTKSRADAKQVYDMATRNKLNEGYTADPTGAADFKARCSGFQSCVEVWEGNSGANHFLCYYGYESTVHAWAVTSNSMSPS